MALTGPDKKSVLEVIKEGKNLPTEEFLKKASAVTQNPDLMPPELPSSPEKREAYQNMVSARAQLAWKVLFSILHRQDLIDWSELYAKKEKPNETGLAVRDKGDLVSKQKSRFKSEFHETEPTKDVNLDKISTGNIERGGLPTKDKNQGGQEYQVPPNEPQISDYYEVLGVSPNASSERIKRARNQLLMEESANTVEGELRANGLSTEEIYLHPRYTAAVRRNQRINEAYTIIGNEKTRSEYDRDYKVEYPERWQTAQAGGANAPTMSISIIANPTTLRSKGTASEQSRAQQYIGGISSLSLNTEDLEGIKSKLGIDINNSHLKAGALFVALGLPPKPTVDLVKKSNLPEPVKKYLLYSAIASQSIVDADPNTFAIFRKIQGNPTPQLPPNTNNEDSKATFLLLDSGKITPDLSNFGQQFKKLFPASSPSTNAINLNRLTSNALQKHGGRAIEKLGLKALSTGVSGFFNTILPAFLAGIPVIGQALALLLKALPLLLGKLFNNIRKFVENNKEVIALGGILGGIAGAPVIALTSAGILFTSGGFSLLTSAFVGVGTIALGFLGAATVGAIGASLLFWVIGFIIFFSVILLVINSNAYVVPYSDPFGTGNVVENPYMSVTKTANQTQLDNPSTITYTIEITARQEDLSNVQVTNYECFAVNKEKQRLACPPTNPTVPTGVQISSGQTFSFTYTVTYDSQYVNSSVTDTITITADAPSRQAITASGAATVCFGDCPSDCFVISNAGQPWPSAYQNFVQGAISTVSGSYPGFATKACINGTIPICYGGASPDGRWGDHFGHGSSCDIKLYTNSDGSPNNVRDVLYVFVHEVGHHIQHVGPSYFSQYRSYSGIGGELPLCNNTVSTDAPDSFGFADSSALYISNTPMSRFRNCSNNGIGGSLQTAYPAHANFVENVMLK